jgi:hypothetical protein
MPCNGSVVSTAWTGVISGLTTGDVLVYYCGYEGSGGTSTTLGTVRMGVTVNGRYENKTEWERGRYTFDKDSIVWCADSIGLLGKYTVDKSIGTLEVECHVGG